MFDNKSIYALNKMEPDAIIYKDADDEIIRLTRDDFTSEEEFFRFKKISDENYRIEENNEQKHKRRTVALDDISELATASPSVEETLAEKQEELRKAELVKLLKSSINNYLTDVQKRRLMMYYINKLSEEEIAVKEKVSHQAVSKSLQAAKKILEKFLRK